MAANSLLKGVDMSGWTAPDAGTNSLRVLVPESESSYDFFEVAALVNSLPDEFHDNYKKWVHTGITLHNIDSRRLYPIFDQFSRKSLKYQEGDSERLWASFKGKHSDNPLTLGSLRYWAKGGATATEVDAGPWFLPAGIFGQKHSQRREPVIHGVVDRGDVCNVIAPAKLGKSFFVMQKGLSVAAGSPWCGFTTEQGKVLIIDNELHPDTIWRRLEAVREAMGLDKTVLENIEIASLRGNLISLTELCERIRRLPKNTFSLIICDAMYRMIPRGSDENANGDVTQLYNLLDAAATEHGCAISVVHHSSKGDQSKKSVTDVGSGAGAQSRAADCHLVLRPHADTGSVVMQAVVRAHAPIKTVVLRREHPLWLVDENADATQVRTKRRVVNVTQFNEWLEVGEYVVTELVERIQAELEQTRDSAEFLVKQAIDMGLLTVVSKRRNEKRRVLKS